MIIEGSLAGNGDNMYKDGIDKLLKEQEEHRQRFKDQLDRNSAANEVLRNLQSEMGRSSRSSLQAIEAITRGFYRPNNAALEAMKMVQREMDRPNNTAREAIRAIQEFDLPRNGALDSIREFQRQMMMPNERLTDLSRSMATISSNLAINKDVIKSLSSTFAPTFAVLRNNPIHIPLPQVDQISKLAADISRRQDEILATAWSPAVLTSTLRKPEMASILEGVTGSFVKYNRSILGSLGQNFFESIRKNGAYEHLEFLGETRFADLAIRVGKAVESSETEEELAANFTAIVEEALQQPDKSRFTTFERISIAFLVLMFLLGAYQAFLQTLQYMDSNRPQPSPVIRIDFLPRFQRDFLERYAPYLLKDDIEVEYFIERDVPLLSAPRWKSQQIGKALAGSRALLFERSHKWIFAEVFHPLGDTSQFGWFNKKYSKRVS